MNQSNADNIAQCCLQLYQQLPKNGKPKKGEEWTVLAGIVQENIKCNDLAVVALATGTKCIGPSKMRNDGRVLHDSHAEVIVRRAFLRYLYFHLELAYSNKQSDVFTSPDPASGTCIFKKDICFHLYISHTPCGDASIIPINQLSNLINNTESRVRRRQGTTPDEPPKKLSKINNSSELGPGTACLLATLDRKHSASANDVLRTGGKPVAGEAKDPQLPGCDYHQTGSLRNKPGRGEATVSMSCSDKIAKWNVVGCLGSLMSHFIPEPLYFVSIVIGKCPYSSEAMDRALYERVAGVCVEPPFSVHLPKLISSKTEFQHRCKENLKPCGSAISWSKLPENPKEVSADGFRLGVIRKKRGTDASQCIISRRSLFSTFMKVKNLVPSPSLLHNTLFADHLLTYSDFKIASAKYQAAWKTLRSEVFKNWLLHDRELDNFIL